MALVEHACPRRLRLSPHLAWSPLASSTHRHGGAHRRESPVAQKLRSRRRETCLYDRHSGAQRAGWEQSLQSTCGTSRGHPSC